jgi:hypothetical protein
METFGGLNARRTATTTAEELARLRVAAEMPPAVRGDPFR